MSSKAVACCWDASGESCSTAWNELSLLADSTTNPPTMHNIVAPRCRNLRDIVCHPSIQLLMMFLHV